MMNRIFQATAGKGKMKMRLGVALLAAMVATAACDLDLTNPNAPTRQEVLTDIEGVVALAVGIQNQYAENVMAFVRAPALVTHELGVTTQTLPSDRSLFTGEGLDASFGVVSSPFSAGYRVILSANTLLESAPGVGLGPGTQTGITALAKLYKAMALGTLIYQYEQVPVDVDLDGAEPQPRPVVLDTILSLLESARRDLDAVSDSQLESFRTRILGDAFDLRNTINAMLARYYLTDGQYQQAIEAAARVDLDVVSVFPYPNPDINPIYNYSVVANYTSPLLEWAEEAEEGDERPDFWLDLDPEARFPGNPPEIILTPLGQYDERNDEYPVYIPDEMRLIAAEAYTYLGDYAAARELINAVRTQVASGSATPAAGLPALPAEALDTEDELLNQVAYERKYELYLQGLRWEDMRRLDAYIEDEPTFQWLPLPTGECQANPAAGC